ncbi:MAG: GlpM family protein [Candidatus Gracilibacteria bacterium]|jgi:membrane protein GlpM
MTLFLKAIAGAIIVVLISLVSASKYYFLAGLIPLFPTFSLISHIIVGQKSAIELKNTAAFGMLSIIPLFAYLLSVYLLSGKLPLYLNLIISVVIWFVLAVVIYVLWTKFHVA